jgi:glycosyltransferase involved in cell wall biosynthesis
LVIVGFFSPKEKKMKRVLIYPNCYSSENSYIHHLSNMLYESFFTDSFSLIRKTPKHLLAYDAYLFNWFEGVSSLKNFFINIVFLLLLHIKKKKIIWTIHNRRPHEKNIYFPLLKLCLCKWSTFIHILTPGTIKLLSLESYREKIVCIPHGDYFGDYPPSAFNLFERYKIPKKNRILLFLGQVRPYKNLEILIKAFVGTNLAEANWTLLICGKFLSKEYKNQIETLAQQNQNIVCDFSFIANENMNSYLTQSSFLIAPYNKESSLNSGTLWMACSYSRSMILPLIPCVQDLGEEKSTFFTYDYQNQEEHLAMLVETLKEMKNAVAQNPNLPDEMGKKAFAVMTERSWQNNKDKWIALVGGESHA